MYLTKLPLGKHSTGTRLKPAKRLFWAANSWGTFNRGYVCYPLRPDPGKKKLTRPVFGECDSDCLGGQSQQSENRTLCICLTTHPSSFQPASFPPTQTWHA